MVLKKYAWYFFFMTVYLQHVSHFSMFFETLNRVFHAHSSHLGASAALSSGFVLL